MNVEKLTDDALCDAIANDYYIEAKDLKQMKKQPSIEEMYIKLNKLERLMKKYEIESIEKLEEILDDYVWGVIR